MGLCIPGGPPEELEPREHRGQELPNVVKRRMSGINRRETRTCRSLPGLQEEWFTHTRTTTKKKRERIMDQLYVHTHLMSDYFRHCTIPHQGGTTSVKTAKLI